MEASRVWRSSTYKETILNSRTQISTVALGILFALATGKSGIELSADDAVDFFAAAGATMARAISRGIHAATPDEGDLFPVWSSR